MAIDRIRTFTVDTMVQKNYFLSEDDINAMFFSQGDNILSKAIIKVQQDGVILPLTGATVAVSFMKADGTSVIQDSTTGVALSNAAQGEITVTLRPQSLAAPGCVLGQVMIMLPGNNVLETSYFSFITKKSLANNAIVSSNELNLVLEAINVGKQFQGVDIPGIINAGTVAAGALQRSGGTMTGNLNIQAMDGAKSIQWYNDQAQLGRFVFHPSGLVEMFGKNGATETSAWNYSPTTNTFNIVSNTNVAKKTGDAFTGAISFNNTSQKNGIQFQTDGVSRSILSGDASRVNLWDNVNAQDVWSYSHSAKRFDVLSDTNLVKKAEAYTDYVQANGNTKVLAVGTDLNTVQATGASAGSGLVNAPGGSSAFWYIETLRYSDTNYVKQVATNITSSTVTVYTRKMTGANTWNAWYETALVNDVMKKTGDIATGAMTFNGVTNMRNNVEHVLQTNTDKGVSIVINDSQSKWSIGPKMTGTVDWSKELSMNLTTGRVTVAALTTKLDDTTNIPLSAEATAPDVNYPLQAVRRNNVIMLKGAVTLNANATGVIVATLPSDLRPTVGNLSIYTPTADTTTNVQVFINGTTGAVAFSSNAKGKRVDFVITYTT